MFGSKHDSHRFERNERSMMKWIVHSCVEDMISSEYKYSKLNLSSAAFALRPRHLRWWDTLKEVNVG